MIVVIDVSGVTEILFHKEKARKFEKVLREATHVITPDLYISELTNTLWKYNKIKKTAEEKCMQFINNGIGFIGNFTNSIDIWQEAFTESINNKHSVYDMFYMVTARRNSAILITNDQELAAICKKNYIQVCH